jgi:VIT1/CCC1 family predicted Fe2+/Mn2+ transporter
MIFDNAVTDINTILAFIFTVIVLIFPFFVISFMLYNF